MGESVGNLKLRGSSMTKPPLGLVPDHALVGASRVLEDSETKYAPGNFMESTTVEALKHYDHALLRHRLLCRPLSGVATPAVYASRDDESGLPHIDHMIAGLLILRTLMIRDGVLPEDPGMGKRKRASMDPAAPGVDTEALRNLAEQLATRELDRRAQEREPECYTCGAPGTMQCDEAIHAVTDSADPDAARRAATDANVERLKREAAEAAETKRKWDQRCLKCNGRGRFNRPPENSDHAGDLCTNCHGTGERTGAEGMRY